MAVTSNYEPYESNAQGFTEALLDFKSTFVGNVPFKVTGYVTTAFENVTQGDAVYARASDGFIGKAIGNDTTGAGNYLTRVGEAGSTGQFIIRIETPILLS